MRFSKCSDNTLAVMRRPAC